jgi:hypothetical protein
MLYTWQGPEHSVGGPFPCTVTKFQIEELVDRKRRLKAQGSISIMDYIENCGGEHRWIAVGELREGGIDWYVRPDDFLSGYVWRDEKRAPIFTLSSIINKNMEQFIAEQLNTMLQQRGPLATSSAAE